MNFKISIQNPFVEREQITENVSSQSSLEMFRNIDWAKMNEEMYTRQDEVKQYFYFYEVSSDNGSQKRTLTISPDFSEKEGINSEELLFMVRYEYPHPEKPGEFLDYKHQHSTYAFAKECVESFVNENRRFFTDHFETPRNKNLKYGGCFKKILMGVIFMLIGIIAFLHFVVGWSHIPEHWLSLKMSLFPEDYNGDPAIQAEIAKNDGTTYSLSDSVTVVEPAPESPIDTLMWANAIKNGDYIPPGVKEELERYKKRDFSKLEKAADKPTDEEAQEAVVRYYKGKVTSLLEQYDAHIKIGTCYNAPLQNTSDGDPEIARVTAMVSAFNTKTGNLGNIQAPLDIIYDFVKYESDPDTWYLADFSQNIPYDYQLNKDRWAN